MLIITKMELKQKMLSSEDNNGIKIQNNNLKEGVSFAKKLKGQALDLVKEYLDRHQFCLLVENDYCWTIWHELL